MVKRIMIQYSLTILKMKNMKSTLLMAFLAIGLMTLSSFNPAKAQTANPFESIPVTYTVNGVLETGTLTITRFITENGQVFAVGNLTGAVAAPVTVPVDLQQTEASCDILNLVLGPLDLNLLGLEVHLNQGVLDVVATAAPGNLLGNLLCTVTHLLDLPGAIIAVVNILNRILAIFG